MEYLSEEKINELSKKFKHMTKSYVEKLNAFREEGMRNNWLYVSIEQPEDNRTTYAEDVYESIKELVKKGDGHKVRDLFPVQTDILFTIQDRKTASRMFEIIVVTKDIFILAIDKYLYTTEDKYNCYQRNCYYYENNTFNKLEKVINIGVCPQKKIFAYVTNDQILLRNGWDGEIVSSVELPKQTELFFNDGTLLTDELNLSDTRFAKFIPFSDGKKFLISSDNFGLILFDRGRFISICPDKELMSKSDEPFLYEQNSLDFDMSHISLSHNNKYIAYGFQSSSHLVFNENGALISELSSISEYPHYALFSKDDQRIMFNSCHFYNGETFDININDLPSKGNKVTRDKLNILDMESRVYAGVSASFGYIIGDAKGYIRARSYKGEHLWDDFVGFNIVGMDITPDEKFLFIIDAGGIIYKIQLNSGERNIYQIGNSTNHEVKRWMFWEKDNIPGLSSD